MGILDKLMGSADIQLTPKSALALAAMTMIAIDGSIEDEELATLQRVVRGDGNAFEQAFRVFKGKTAKECVQTVSKTMTDQKQRLATVAVLLDIAMTDGVLAGAERELMQAYFDAFQLPEEAVKDVVDVIAVKNDFSIFR